MSSDTGQRVGEVIRKEDTQSSKKKEHIPTFGVFIALRRAHASFHIENFISLYSQIVYNKYFLKNNIYIWAGIFI